MLLSKVGETKDTITLGWNPVPGAEGYRFYADGKLVSRTFDPARRTVRFSKGALSYSVEVIQFRTIDTGQWPLQAYIQVAPRVAFKDGGSDARFCTIDQPGVVPEPGAPDGHTIDQSGATYDDNGLCKNGLRSDGPAVTSALEIDGRPYCSLPTMGNAKDNSGSWAV